MVREFIGWADQYTPLTPQQREGALSFIHGLLESRGKINVAAVAMLVWIYLSSSACVFGVCLNAARAEIRATTSDTPDHSFPPNTNLT